ncbi:aspartate aminotransferase [Lachnospiraceae bacterium XPB1003]|nr:aspartate aminotransferase [Lachnospiraceae bacterium XPB1003]
MSLSLSKRSEQVKPSSTLAITAKAKELRAQGRDVVGFGAGEPDFATPSNICDAAINAIKDGFTKYTPAAGTVELKEAVCGKLEKFNHLHYDPAQVIICNGGKHALTNIFDALINPGDEVIIPAPYWLSYPEMVKLSDGVPVIVYSTKENGYKVTAEQIAAAVTDKTKAIVLNTPNNPTGMVYSRQELEAIAKVAVEKDFYVVADEMYEALIYTGEEHVSIASLGDEIYNRTITCSGLSKSYAMTGWRVGYAAAPLEITKRMSAMQSHATSNVNSIAQKAAVEALTGPDEAMKKMKEEFDRRRQYMYGRVKDMPLVSCLEPEGAFYVFIDMSEVCKKEYKGEKIEKAAKIADILLNEFDTAVVPCADFGYPEHVRLSYAISMEQIEKGLDRIEKFLKSL